MTFYYNTLAPDFYLRFKIQFENIAAKEDIVFLCIGTDKITGDSLGPYIGTQLKKRGLCVYGCIGDTVNATNLTAAAVRIYREHKHPFIVAVDACLGRKEHVGYASLSTEKLKAGAGVNKALLPVGNIAVTGIVTEFGTDSFTRLMNVPAEKIALMGNAMARALCAAATAKERI